MLNVNADWSKELENQEKAEEIAKKIVNNMFGNESIKIDKDDMIEILRAYWLELQRSLRI